MCLLAVCYNALPDAPLLVFANRDERRSRHSESPRLHDLENNEAWLGGRDVAHGGTWLGLNRHGLVVAVTNRPKTTVAANLRSRGLLCRELLNCESVQVAAAEAQRQMAESEFAGFNLLLLSAAQCTVIEAGDTPSVFELPSGIHVIANRGLNDPADPRVARAKREIEIRQPEWTGWRECMRSAAEICRLPPEDQLPGLCLTGSDWGTVSSTIVALTSDVSQASYLFAPGPPSNVPYDDYSPDARRLLNMDTPPTVNDAEVHRMHLRGPWDVEWVLGAESPPPRPSPARGEGERPTSCVERVKLPADWRALFGEQDGTVRFTRRFGKPTNLEPHERVFVAFDGVGGVARVSVNGTHVGIIENNNSMVRFDVTALLRPSNSVDVELSYIAKGNESPGGLYAPVAIEVHR